MGCHVICHTGCHVTGPDGAPCVIQSAWSCPTKWQKPYPDGRSPGRLHTLAFFTAPPQSCRVSDISAGQTGLADPLVISITQLAWWAGPRQGSLISEHTLSPHLCPFVSRQGAGHTSFSSHLFFCHLCLCFIVRGNTPVLFSRGRVFSSCFTFWVFPLNLFDHCYLTYSDTLFIMITQGTGHRCMGRKVDWS